MHSAGLSFGSVCPGAEDPVAPAEVDLPGAEGCMDGGVKPKIVLVYIHTTVVWNLSRNSIIFCLNIFLAFVSDRFWKNHSVR